MRTHRFKVSTLLILVLTFLTYSFAIYWEELPEPIKANELAKEGKLIWQEKNCISCHQLYGLGGHLGPDLTNVAEKRPDEYLKAFLKTGTKVMPNFNLSEREMNALIAFLKYTNTTGKSDPTTFKVNIDGTIE